MLHIGGKKRVHPKLVLKVGFVLSEDVIYTMENQHGSCNLQLSLQFTSTVKMVSWQAGVKRAGKVLLWGQQWAGWICLSPLSPELMPSTVRGRRWRSLPSARKAGPPRSGTAAFSIGTGVWGREAWPWQTEEALRPKERFCSLFPQRPFLLSFQLEQSCNCRMQSAAFCLCCRGDISCWPRYLFSGESH